MKRIILAMLFALPVFATVAGASPVSDCYDKLIASCTGDWGDSTYRACVKGAMNHCDSQHSKKGLGFKIRTPSPQLQFTTAVPHHTSSSIH